MIVGLIQSEVRHHANKTKKSEYLCIFEKQKEGSPAAMLLQHSVTLFSSNPTFIERLRKTIIRRACLIDMPSSVVISYHEIDSVGDQTSCCR